ncbi:hypothetical protein G8761_25870 [Bacillus sp. C11]|nr:hypothetical protein [Neobacillus terrae]
MQKSRKNDEISHPNCLYWMPADRCPCMIMAYARREDFWIRKTGSGLLSLIVLAVLLYSGLLRHRKATGKRRRFHYAMAFVFFSIVILHVFL